MKHLISPTMANNLIAMSLCANKDPRQAVGEPYTIPNEEIRRLRASLILEEALETIRSLGFLVVAEPYQGIILTPSHTGPDLEGVIDGVCDTIYVCLGTLASCGVPDVPHLAEICEANLDKFPGGKAIFREDGKFLKPDGWEPPNHKGVRMKTEEEMSVLAMATILVTQFRGKHETS